MVKITKYKCPECKMAVLDEETWEDTFYYAKRTLRILICNVFRFVNKYIFKTYPLIEDCSRCEDCGRNVHDFHVPNNLWVLVYGSESGVLCWDCFVDRAEKKGIYCVFSHVHDRKKWKSGNV